MLDKLFYYLALPLFVPHFLLYKLMGKEFLREDLHRWSESFGYSKMSDCASFFRLVVGFREFRSLFYWRVGGIQRLFSWYAPGMAACYIRARKGTIGPGLVIQHGHSTRIAPRSAGKNLMVWQNVTIGKDRSGGKAPVLGDNVKIMTGSLVFGDISIGNNVIIGGGTVLYKSVPDNCVVVGNPARIVKKDGVRVDIKL